MKFTPIFDNHTTKKYPVWRIDNLPDFPTLEDSGWLSAEEYYSGNHSKKYAEGYVGKWIYPDFTDEMFEVTRDILINVREHLLTQTDYYISSTWPDKIFKEKIHQHMDHYERMTPSRTIDIWRDSANYRQGVHIDNSFVIATLIFNLKDNPENSGTKYYKNYNMDDTPFPPADSYSYQSPTEKGTGTLHINTPYLVHEGWNNSDGVREVGYYNLIV